MKGKEYILEVKMWPRSHYFLMERRDPFVKAHCIRKLTEEEVKVLECQE